MLQYVGIDVAFVVKFYALEPDLERVDSDLWPVQLDTLAHANVPNFLNGAMRKILFAASKNKKIRAKNDGLVYKKLWPNPADAARFSGLGAKMSALWIT